MSSSRLPALAGAILADIPLEFRDDGCSSSPDALFGYDLRWACRIHDWWWCTRAHPLGQLTEDWKAAGDHILGVLVRSALPWGLRWIGTLYLRAVRRFAGSYDSCGHEELYCRHCLARPHWMLMPAGEILVKPGKVVLDSLHGDGGEKALLSAIGGENGR